MLRGERKGVKWAIVAAVVVGGVALTAFALSGSAQVMTDLGLAPASGSPCAVTVHAENVADDAIQSAINTYPGGTICVSAGVFPEQLTISSPGTTLKGAGATKTIIEPNTVSFNTVDWDSAALGGPAVCGTLTCVPLAAIILVSSSTPPPAATPTTGVTIEDLTVNGAAASSSVTCGDDYVGVDFQDAGGTLASSDVTDVASPIASFGCQEVSGAVYAYNGYYYSNTPPSSPVSVTVSGTTVTGYQKNGITCDDLNESCTLTSDTVTGIGPTSLTGQNGIQVAYGALATVTHSTISGNSYIGPTSTNDWYGPAGNYSATGILLYDSASGTTVSSNTLTQNQIGIAYYDDGTLDAGSASTAISSNTVKGSNGYGIVANGAPGGGDSVTISSNTINNEQSLGFSAWGAPGILVDTGIFSLTDNSILGSSTASGSSNGASQIVCDPSGEYAGTCSSTLSLGTSAIQAASENGNNPTYVTLGSNTFTKDSNELETLCVLGGVVDVDWV